MTTKSGGKESKARKPKVSKRKVVKKESPALNGPVVLEPQLCIQNTAELADYLTPSLRAEGPVTVDISQVKSIDTAGIQVILAFVNDVQAQSRKITWEGISTSLQEALELLDLDRYIDIKPAEDVEEDDGLCPVF